MKEPVNIITLKWGTLYGPEYVNRLYHGVKKNLTRPFRFICFTDNPDDVEEGVECLNFPKFPDDPRYSWSAWRKFSILRDDVPFDGLSLFLDLDILITGPMDGFFEFGKPDQFVIIHNWIEWHKTLFRPRPDIGNSSVFRFPAKQFSFAYEQFLRETERALTEFPTEQAYLTYCMRDRKTFWPEAWVRSFKRHCRPLFPLNYLVPPSCPKDARIIAFHGRPHPDQALEGFKGKKPHHYVRPAVWIKEYWS
jgi:hypothetical protein